MNLNRFPSVDKRPLDLYKLKKAVAQRGGFEKVCKLKKWAEIGRDLGYSGKIMSSLSTSLKNSYQRWLHPYEEYLKLAKPGVQQQLEYEHGGPFTPSSANQPMKDSHQNTPISMRDDSPAIKASAALNASIKEIGDPLDAGSSAAEPPLPTANSGFTAVNTGGFTPVNLTQASFQAVNAPPPLAKRESENGLFGVPSHNSTVSFGPSPKDFPDYLSPAPLTNGHSSNPLKRTISHDSLNGALGTDSGAGAGAGVDTDDQLERRSKRAKKGSCFRHSSILLSRHRSLCSTDEMLTKNTAPTVVGSHMSLLRPTTPRLSGDRRNGKPGEVSCPAQADCDKAERSCRSAKSAGPKTSVLVY